MKILPVLPYVIAMLISFHRLPHIESILALATTGRIIAVIADPSTVYGVTISYIAIKGVEMGGGTNPIPL